MWCYLHIPRSPSLNVLDSPAILKLVMLQPLIPFIIRNFSLYWRNKLVDWVPIPYLKEMRTITETMYRTSKRIFEEKKAEMDPLLAHEVKKDIMSIMCECVVLL